MDTLENQNIDVDVSDTPELSSAWIEVDLEDFQYILAQLLGFYTKLVLQKSCQTKYL